MNPATLKALAQFPQQLEGFYDAIPHEYKLWAPASWEGIPSERLTALEQICHVRDIEIEGYQVRFRRAHLEENPFLPSIDGAIKDGLATVERVQIRFYRSGQQQTADAKGS